VVIWEKPNGTALAKRRCNRGRSGAPSPPAHAGGSGVAGFGIREPIGTQLGFQPDIETRNCRPLSRPSPFGAAGNCAAA